MSFIQRIKDDEMEGELIKQQVEAELEREKMRELERKKRAAEQREDFKRANEDLIRLQAEVAIKTKEEDKRILEH